MKKFYSVVLVLMAFVFSVSYSSVRTEPYSKREIKNGLICLIGENNPYTGILVSYYEGSQLEAIMTYRNGLLEGERVIYYRNGLIKSKETYRDGKKEGFSLIYYDNGKPMIKTQYVNGKKHGEKILYNKNGLVRETISYKKGRKIRHPENSSVKLETTDSAL